jgi:hypothetical protein
VPEPPRYARRGRGTVKLSAGQGQDISICQVVSAGVS